MGDRWIRVNGIVQEGHQVASGRAKQSPYPKGTIEMQIPLFQARGIDLSPYFPGTLNLSIHPFTMLLKQPQYTFQQVHWTTKHPPEDFSFSGCRLLAAGHLYEGLIYYPHPETKKTHFQDASTVEVLAPLIAGISYGDRVEIDVNPDEITLTRLVIEADQDLEAQPLPDA
jgi:hypothetical protein